MRIHTHTHIARARSLWCFGLAKAVFTTRYIVPVHSKACSVPSNCRRRSLSRWISIFMPNPGFATQLFLAFVSHFFAAMQLTPSTIASLLTISKPRLCYRARSLSFSQTLARSWVPRQTPLLNGVATLAPVAINYFSTPGGPSMKMLLPITNPSPSCITGVLDTYDAAAATRFSF